ncbi:MAG: DNA-binding protein, partial [Candidatus Woesearchaeota archaeon]
MAKNLTSSTIDRQNILNNQYALAEIKKSIGIKCIVFNGKEVLLKEQVAEFFEVTPRTINNYLAKNEMELRQNGYEIVRGKPLLDLKKVIFSMDVHEIDFMNIKKSPQLGIFDFRAFLNLTMLLVESERAKLLRQVILDIVIDTINKRTGGGTKYINQRDEDYVFSYFQAENYRKEFTDALKDCLDMGNFKYPIYADK